MFKVLFVYPQEHPSQEIAERLDSGGFRVSYFSDLDGAFSEFQEKLFDLMILSDRFPLERVKLLIDQAHMINEQFPVFLLSGAAAEAPKVPWSGNSNVLTVREPTDPAMLEHLCSQKARETKLRHQVDYLRHREPYIYNFDQIIGHDSGLAEVAQNIKKVSRSNCAVLLTGETGTGKELIAAAIHYNSLRRTENFVAVNCAALHENLLESELFGHEKGAFTGADKGRVGRFEQANGGTLFLDEIGEMSLSTQAKVLRILQNQQFERLGSSQTICVDVRIIAATNRELKLAIRQNHFREDLFYRLNVFPIHIPPLNSRKQDIPLLSRFFLNKYRGEYNKGIDGMHPKGIGKLMEYHWPGNVRELQNVIERAVLMCEQRMINPEDIEFDVATAGRSVAAKDEEQTEILTLDELERSYIVRMLQKTRGVQKDAAALLGVSARALHYKIRKHGIDVEKCKLQ